jgi:hypothetical protein
MNRMMLCCLIGIGLACLALACAGGQHADRPKGAEQTGKESVARAALPTERHLRSLGFADFLPGKSTVPPEVGSESTVSATRKRDGLHLFLEVFAAANDEQAEKWLKSRHEGNTIPYLPRSPSGRKIGQAVWQSQQEDGGPLRGSFDLLARDGRSIVKVQLMHRVLHDPFGNPIHQVFSVMDLRMAERLAVDILDRLTEKGYTSRPVKSAEKKR